MTATEGDDRPCEFCRIAAGESDAHRLHETDDVVAFLDVNPAVEGHALVAPKRHVEDLVTAESDLSVSVFRSARTVAAGLETVLDVDGYTVVHTSGSLIGSVEHAHIHLLPRTENDRVSFRLVRRDLDDQEASALAERVREAV